MILARARTYAIAKIQRIIGFAKKRFSFPFRTPALHQPYYSPTPTERGRTPLRSLKEHQRRGEGGH